jgi:hypothetical protein
VAAVALDSLEKGVNHLGRKPERDRPVQLPQRRVEPYRIQGEQRQERGSMQEIASFIIYN